MKTIGKKIKELRHNNEVSQEELAFQLGVSRQIISKWESDTVLPSTDSIMAICDFFNVPSDYLLGNGETENGELAKNNTAAAEANKNNIMTKKQKILFAGLLVLFSIMLALGIFISCITLNIINQPTSGYDEAHVVHIDSSVAVVGIALSVVSAALIILLVVLLIKKNKR